FWSTKRLETTDEGTKILATVDGKLRTISKSSIRRNLKLNDEAGISSLPDAKLFENLALMGYNILPNQKFTFEVSNPYHYEVFKSEKYSLEAGQDRENIIMTSALPHDATPRVNSLAADEGSMQEQLNNLMDLCTRLQRQQTKMASKITAQDLEISNLKAQIKIVEDKDGGCTEPSEEDATIKGRSLETWEEAGVEKSTERRTVSVPPVTEIPTVGIPTGSGMVPTASLIFTTVSVVTPYSRRKGKEKMVESDTPKKKKLQEQIDLQGITLEEIRENFILVWEHIEDFVPMASKEEGERFKRKGLRLEQSSAKKIKTAEDVSKEDLKQMMQLVPVEEVYVEALQVKHPIIDWEIHTEGQRNYWKIIRLGRHTTVYQFFVDMLKHFDREDLNQLLTLVKETLSIRQTTTNKEKEL
nr:hypothetical protein [Tanacetum cinerariifolium]